MLMKKCKVEQNSKGFTLVELMIVIGLLAIVASIATPNFIEFIRNNQLQAKTNELVGFLQHARGQSLINKTAYEIDVSSENEWKLIARKDSTVERILEFNVSQAKPTVSSVDGNKIVYKSNGMTNENINITVCREGDHASGYFIEIKPAGTIYSYPRGKKSSTESMSTCATN